MTTYYFDSSALVKLYYPETGSEWIEQIVNDLDEESRPANLIVITQIGIVEVAAAFARLQRTGQITQDQRDHLYTSILEDDNIAFRSYALTEDIVKLAAGLTQKHTLRGYDAVHLASAIKLDQRISRAGYARLKFISADNQLCNASIAEGLTTINPHQYS